MPPPSRKADCHPEERHCAHELCRHCYYKQRNQGKRWFLKSHLNRAYGISLSDWDDLILSQAGLCACCEDYMVKPCVDHCHETGQVRGLLCHQCNTAAGMMDDSSDKALMLHEYLLRHGK